jgi:hypothetical protein
MTSRCEDARDKLYETVGTLAVSEVPLQERLADVWADLVEELPASAIAELPAHLQRSYRWIHDTITGGGDAAAIRATCAKMTTEKAGDVITEILTLYANVELALYETEAETEADDDEGREEEPGSLTSAASPPQQPPASRVRRNGVGEEV